MSFNRNTNTARNDDNAPAFDKAKGWLNLYLPSKEEGKMRKLGAIPLREGKPAEKNLLEWLNEDPARVQVLLSKLTIQYQSGEASDKAGFDL